MWVGIHAGERSSFMTGLLWKIMNETAEASFWSTIVVLCLAIKRFCIPGNTQWVQKEREEIFNTIMPEPVVSEKDWKDMPKKWVEQYNIWDKKWEN